MKTANTCARLVLGAVLFAMMTLPFSFAPTFGVRRTTAAELEGRAGADLADDCLPKDPPPPVIKLKVRVAKCTEPGRTIEYRICVENCSTMEAHHVVVKNTMPGNAKFVKSDPEPTKQGPDLHWNLGTIGGGAVREIVLTLQPTNKEDVKNCVRVVFEHGVCLVTRQACLPGRPPLITEVPEVTRPEDLPVIELTVRGPKEQYTNLAGKYEIMVTNKGKTKVTNLQIQALVPDKMKIETTSKPGKAIENGAAWNLGQLDPGASHSLQLSLRANEKGEFCFKVAAVADHGVKKETEFCTKFVGVSAISVEMHDRDGTDPSFIGHKVSYPIVVRSLGNDPVTNLRVRAFIPDTLKLEKTTPPLLEKREAVKGGEIIEFKTLPQIDGGAQVRYEVYVEALRGGVTFFRTEILADQLDVGRPVIEEESTTVVDDRDAPAAPPPFKKLSRMK